MAKLFSIQRAISRDRLGKDTYITVEWDKPLRAYRIGVMALGDDKNDLLEALDKMRMELDLMYYKVKQEILDERQSHVGEERVEF